MQDRLEVGEPRVRPERSAISSARTRPADPLDQVRALGLIGGERLHLGLGPVRPRGAQPFSAPPSFGTSRFASASTCGSSGVLLEPKDLRALLEAAAGTRVSRR